MARRSLPACLGRDDRGVTAVEFALIAPALILTLMGLFDISYNVYASAVLNGAIQKAARDSTIEGGMSNESTLDDRVETAVHKVVPNALVVPSRKYYTNYADVAKPEDFVDSGALDGVCNNGETFEDLNGNGVWDADRGSTGFGSARDAILYEVNVTYDRAFPMAGLIGLPATVTVKSQTVLRNQPFTLQNVPVPVDGICP